eukprot:TRINITY_DN2512_c0_g1_i1.p1 TRINITY_DN2512_c0_g1~~TRINITY_DN2512_c0_g1_i1.p1  ORF type:complete len:584 (+),score=74.27 TRINITY_DN2512_c0_g1_i1:111-1862(+)
MCACHPSRGKITDLEAKFDQKILSKQLRITAVRRRNFHLASNAKFSKNTPSKFYKTESEVRQILDDLSKNGPGQVLTLAAIPPDLYRSEMDLIHSILHHRGAKLYANISRYEPYFDYSLYGAEEFMWGLVPPEPEPTEMAKILKEVMIDFECGSELKLNEKDAYSSFVPIGKNGLWASAPIVQPKETSYKIKLFSIGETNDFVAVGEIAIPWERNPTVLVDKSSESVFVFDRPESPSKSEPVAPKAHWIRWSQSSGCSDVEIELTWLGGGRIFPCAISGDFLITKSPSNIMEVVNLGTMDRFEAAAGNLVAINEENATELCVVDSVSDEKVINFINLETGRLSQQSLRFKPAEWPDFIPLHSGSVSFNNHLCAVATQESVVLIRRDNGKVVGWFFASNESEMRQVVRPKVALIGHTAMVVSSKDAIQLVKFDYNESHSTGALDSFVVDAALGAVPRNMDLDPRRVLEGIETSLLVASECVGSITKKLPDGAIATIYFDRTVQQSATTPTNQYIASNYCQYEEIPSSFSSYRFETKPPLPAAYKFATERKARAASAAAETVESEATGRSTFSGPRGTCVVLISK